MVAGGVEPPSEVAYYIAFFVRLKFLVPSFVPSNFRAAPLQIEEKGRPDLYAARSMRVRISLTSHAAIRGPNFLVGFGNLPSEMPFHHVDRETGINANTSGSRI